MRWVYAALSLAAVYLSMIGSVSPANLAAAAAVAAALACVWVRPGRARRPRALRRLVYIPRLALGAAREAVRGSWTVTLVIVGRRSWQKVGMIDMPLGERSDLGAAVTALVVTISPGSVVIDIDPDLRVFRVSVIDATAEGAVKEANERFYRRYQKPLIP